MAKFEIRYYITEGSFKTKVPAFKETINGDNKYVENWAQNKLKHSQFKYYDIEQK